MTTFILLRHADTDEVGKVLSGRRPVELNATGTKQAEALVARLNDIRISAIYSSPMRRALHTVAPLSEQRQLNVLIHDSFNEIDFGDWTGKTIDTLRDDETFRLFNAQRSTTRIPGGETMLEAQKRAVSAIDQITKQNVNQNVLVVSHGDVIKSLIAYYAGVHVDMMQRLEISPASLNIVTVGHDDFISVRQVNNTGRIELY